MSSSFEEKYFEDHYKALPYQNYPWFETVVHEIVKRKPASVIDFGCGRGYVVKRLNSQGVKAFGIDVSDFCFMTRATKHMLPGDATTLGTAPTPQDDLAFSYDFLDELPQDKVEAVLKKMAASCSRGLHVVKDPKAWAPVFARVVPGHAVDLLYIEDFQGKVPMKDPRAPPGSQKTIVNYGSFIVMHQSTPECRVLNVDILDCSQYAHALGYDFYQNDVRDTEHGMWPIENSVDAIVTSHMFEHLTREEGAAFLQKCLESLKPGGYIRIAVPDAYKLAGEYMQGFIQRHGTYNVDVRKAPDRAAKFLHLLIGGDHKTIYDASALCGVLEKAGFVDVQQSEFDETKSELLAKYTYDMFPELSLYVEARKPDEAYSLSKEEKTRSTGDTHVETPSTSVKVSDPLASEGVVETVGERERASVVVDDTAKLAAANSTTIKREKFQKIALISTPFLRTPPGGKQGGYGGLELIVANLGKELAKRGYDVTIFAAEGSEVEGCKVVSVGKEIGTVNVDWLEAEGKAFFGVIRDKILTGGFDIVHGSTWFGHEYSLLQDKPDLTVLHTHHGGLSWPPYGHTDYPKHLRNAKFNMIAISRWMQKVYKEAIVELPDKSRVPLGFDSQVAYNGVDLDKYKMRTEKGDRLLFVGRLDDFKNPKHAILAAQEAKMPIDLVGGSFVYNTKYLEEVKALCGKPECRLYLNAPDDLKITLMQNAKAVLIPSTMNEPFNLVAIEASACGTPVICYSDGGLSETVKDGISGYIVERGNVHAMTEAITSLDKRIIPIEPRNCRKWAEDNFSIQRMADRYIELYQRAYEGNSW